MRRSRHSFSCTLLVVIVGFGLGPATALAAPRTAPKPSSSASNVSEKQPIDASEVWRWEEPIFSEETLHKLEPILRATRCSDDKGCGYHDDGRKASRDGPDFLLIPWRVSRAAAYLVRIDRCGAGGCDQGLFVKVGGRWRLVVEGFGEIERDDEATLGFRDLVFRPRLVAPIRLQWNGRGYREPAATAGSR